MNKVLMITGTSRGLGSYLRDYYLHEGYKVIGCSRKDIDFEHANYTHYCLDVSNEAAVKNMVSDSCHQHNAIDGLICNAGIASMNHLLLTPYSSMQDIFETNVYGTLLFCREVGKAMLIQKKGRIINLSSVASPMHLAGEAVYASSKAAIESLTKTIAKELAPYQITVNAVGASPLKTDLTRGVSAEKMEELISQQTIKRWGEMEDVVNIIDFFLHERSDFITGQVLYLGGSG